MRAELWRFKVSWNVWSGLARGRGLKSRKTWKQASTFQKKWGSRYGIRESPRNTAPVAPEEPSGRLPDHPRHSPSLLGTDPRGPREPWKPHLTTCYYFCSSCLLLFFVVPRTASNERVQRIHGFRLTCITTFRDFESWLELRAAW